MTNAGTSDCRALRDVGTPLIPHIVHSHLLLIQYVELDIDMR